MHNKVVALAQYTVSVNHWRQSFSSRCFPAVEHSAVEVMSAPSLTVLGNVPRLISSVVPLPNPVQFPRSEVIISGTKIFFSYFGLLTANKCILVMIMAVDAVLLQRDTRITADTGAAAVIPAWKRKVFLLFVKRTLLQVVLEWFIRVC